MKTALSLATLAEATLADATTVPAPAAAGRNRRAWPATRSLGRVGWARPGLLGLLALTAVLYLWGLGRNGNANDFYAAAVKAGTESWKAFFFGSFDAANYITVDKPPASLWVMELSGRIFGFSSWSMLVPQALEGIAAVGLLYATVRRWFSPAAALASGLVLAVTPVAALMFRFNNPDALLVLLLVAAAYATVRAVETAGTRWLALAGGALGLAFLTKMFQAFLVVPAFALVYLVAAPTPLRRRLWQLVVAGCALVVSSGWWVAVVALTPAADRPYVGGSTNNSILDLILGYNGLGRITGNEAGGGGGGGPQFSGSPGLTRLFNSLMGGQISWLLPPALLALPIGIWLTRRAPRTDRYRAALIIWGGWLLVTGIVYSYAGGIIHTYYTNTLAPPIAALVGITAVGLWQARSRLAARLALGALLTATAVWSYVLLERTPGWHPWLRWAVVAGGAGVTITIVVAGGRLHRFALAGLVAAGALSALGGPLAYTLSTVTSTQGGAVVAAGPAAAGGGTGGGFAGGRGSTGGSGSHPGPGGTGFPGGSSGNGAADGNSGPPTGTRPSGSRPSGVTGQAGRGGTTVSTALVALLKQDAGSYTWVAATTSSSSAAPIELATGQAVMAIGGFTGSDPSTTLAQFRRLVAGGKIHYYLASGGGGRPGGGNNSSSITSWVTSHFKAITVGGTTLYDLTLSSSSSSGAA